MTQVSAANREGLVPGLVCYVDEAGGLDFRPSSGGVPATPFVACAVLLPEYRRQALLDIVPRDPASGRLLKSTDREMTEAMAAEFVRRLSGLDFYAGMVFIDTSAADSISTAEDATFFSNEKRKGEHRKKVKTPNLMYEVFVADAVSRAWGAYCMVHKHYLGMADVVLDTKPISAQLRDEVARNLRSAFLKSANLKICDVRWASEEQEPLLLVPDHLAGLVHRNVTRKECVEAWDLLLPAKNSGRLQIQDGREFTTLPERRPVGGTSPPAK